MKNAFSKTNLLALGLLLLLLPGITSCKKDKIAPTPTVRESLVGEWKIKSFTIDGTEVKGSVISDSKMRFKAYTGINGDFEWSIIYTDGSSEIQSGDYTVDEEDKKINLENTTGDRLKFDFELNGNTLELSGIVDGDRVVLKSDRN